MGRLFCFNEEYHCDNLDCPHHISKAKKGGWVNQADLSKDCDKFICGKVRKKRIII